MNKILKSMFLSIILSGIILIIVHYFSVLSINNFLIIFSLLFFFFIIFYFYFKRKNYRYTEKEIFNKYLKSNRTEDIENTVEYTKEEKQILNSSPKYTKEEIINKYNLQVKQENESSQNIVVNSSPISININKKPKEIPKQNLSYKNYANIFKTINQDIQENKVQNIEVNKENSLKVIKENKKLKEGSSEEENIG